ncbi:hypothetical protein [Mesorhizobium sp. M9A.F.Ca.ET.002.03.1.2]|uniref:hypothetical protein n=1 Tax=Mesorhizobium sp. M9A.F.Ca.ET.002.03.1.2 TaxID=2493668 RepID=UPI00167B549D|nr:hypothetical protein [Mesorhizobium sp. M9A.F.Ca.ET.002.03.1.2]
MHETKDCAAVAFCGWQRHAWRQRILRQMRFLNGAAGRDLPTKTLSLEKEPVWHRYGVMFWQVLVWLPCWLAFLPPSI